MTTHTLMEYLQQFPPGSIPAMAVVDKERRLKYPVWDTVGVTGEERPLIILDVGEPESLDGEDKNGQND